MRRMLAADRELVEELAQLYSAFLRGLPLSDDAAMRARMVELFKACGIQACRKCGCTENTACDVAGDGCSWVEPDLCSACFVQPAIAAKPLRTLKPPRGAR